MSYTPPMAVTHRRFEYVYPNEADAVALCSQAIRENLVPIGEPVTCSECQRIEKWAMGIEQTRAHPSMLDSDPAKPPRMVYATRGCPEHQADAAAMWNEGDGVVRARCRRCGRALEVFATQAR